MIYFDERVMETVDYKWTAKGATVVPMTIIIILIKGNNIHFI